MKKAGYLCCNTGFALLLLLLTISNTAKCQFYMWYQQKALTDSAADNINPTIAFYYGNDNREHSLLFWQRSTDPSSTSIWYKCLDEGFPQEPTELISTPGVHYTNPKVVVLSNSIPTEDSAFMLFFESDASGNKDLYSVKYYNNSSFTAPQLFSGLPGDDINLSLVWGYSTFAVWENDGRILKADWNFQSNSFLAPVILSDEGSHDPVGTEMMIYWLRDTLQESKVVYMKKEYISGNWVYLGPYDLETEGTSSRLESSKGFFMFAPQPYIVWQNTQGNTPTQLRFAYDNSTNMEVLHLGSANYNYSSPDVMDFPMIIKIPTLLTFVTDSTGNDEVMANSGFSIGLNDPVNLSAFDGPDRNPHFFGTVSAYIFSANLLWESLRNGHWTIFYSHYDFTVGTNANEAGNGLQATPNPFDDHISISLPAESGGTIFIRNSLNITVKSITTNKYPNSQGRQYYWDGTDESGKQVPPGVYFIAYSYGTKILTQKIIRK